MLVFDIPPKGTNITVSEILEQHRDAITDIAAELGQAPVCVGSALLAATWARGAGGVPGGGWMSSTDSSCSLSPTAVSGTPCRCQLWEAEVYTGPSCG